MAALSSIAGQMGAGVVSLQKMAGQMNALGAAGFDAKGMMGNLDNKYRHGSCVGGAGNCRNGRYGINYWFS